MVRERERRVSTGKSEHDRVAAHFRVVICVSLRMAASAEAPSSPMLLDERLQRRGAWVGTVRQYRRVNGR